MRAFGKLAPALPSGLPSAPVMIQEAGVLDEGRFSLGYDNKCLYRILGDTARLRPEHDTSLPGLRALSATALAAAWIRNKEFSTMPSCGKLVNDAAWGQCRLGPASSFWANTCAAASADAEPQAG